MDPVNDCPICFETYVVDANCERWQAPCCAQYICKTCGENLRRCPFCRTLWHGEEDDEADGRHHPWLRAPALAFMAASLAPEVIPAGVAGARALAIGAAAALAEVSPAVLVGGIAGAAALAGGAAVVVASQHSESQARRLQDGIRNRERVYPVAVPWREIAMRLWETLDWHLSPQKAGMPHVYHGSPWRSRAREEHMAQLAALLRPRDTDVGRPVGDAPSNTGRGTSTSSSLRQDRGRGVAAAGSSGAPVVLTANDSMWGDLLFCFNLWLQYNPHTANWGHCSSYGPPPFHLCWHNRWREDMRHSLASLAAKLTRDTQSGRQGHSVERSCALCLLGTLDHVLSWDVATPNLGSSELVDCYSYPSFCQQLKERFAFAWGAAMAPPGADLDLVGFDEHVQGMAARSVPVGFRDVW
eukprot:TRINITY_DN26354_c0_g1_i1.p1 TRINITY_DN26354_c0_g1~~TRINITY_DN26354_c0_g1_i1.p1  ORF type:complete len:413 (-),score=55.22 TRINITY_DN26354_c0_g1_i1:366-1604(-)